MKDFFHNIQKATNIWFIGHARWVSFFLLMNEFAIWWMTFYVVEFCYQKTAIFTKHLNAFYVFQYWSNFLVSRQSSLDCYFHCFFYLSFFHNDRRGTFLSYSSNFLQRERSHQIFKFTSPLIAMEFLWLLADFTCFQSDR